MTYDQHLAERLKWKNGAEAEWRGFLSAKLEPDAPPTIYQVFYPDAPYLRERFLQGYQDGKSALLMDSPLTTHTGKG